MTSLRRSAAACGLAAALLLTPASPWLGARTAVPGFVPLAAAQEQAPVPPASPAAPAAPAEPTVPAASQPQDDSSGVTIRRLGPPAVRIGQDYTLPAGQSAREVVVVSGSAIIAGEVEQDMVVVLGTVRLASTAILHRDLVVVGGQLTVEPGATVRRDLVVVGSGFEAPPGFSAGGEQVVVGPPFGNAMRSVLPWVTYGLLWGRLIVPSMPWMWTLVAILFAVYLLLNLVFHRAIRTTADTLADKPLSAFLVGLLVLLLTAPVSFILAVSIVGIAVLPFVNVALVVAVVLGKVAVMRWIGASVVTEGDPENRMQATRSFAMGFAVITLMYAVPILGLVAFASTSVLGLGGATMALMAALRRENPKPPADSRENVHLPPEPSPAGSGVMPAAAAPPGFVTAAAAPHEPAPTSTTGAPGYAPLPSAAGGGSQAAGEASGAAPAFVPPPSPPPPVRPPAARVDGGRFLSMPKAEFLERAAAFGLDCLLVLLVYAFLDFRTNNDSGAFFLLLLAYHIAFWTWKGTTVGGIICNLRVIRTDGAPLQFAEALVRGLSSIFSLALVGLGAFWILRDPERQSWHDRIAGTYVVKVPRGYPV
jgi:uncharacterized RDD family membrane protein YckC